MSALLPQDIAHEIKALGGLNDTSGDVRVLALAIAAALAKVDKPEGYDSLWRTAAAAALEWMRDPNRGTFTLARHAIHYALVHGHIDCIGGCLHPLTRARQELDMLGLRPPGGAA